MMRWLLVALLVSLVALLIAAAGVARHVWVRRDRARSKASASIADSAPAEEVETEPDI
jgi:uncharacterized membrane protein